MTVQLCSECGVRPVRMVLSNVPLCDRCSDLRVAAITGFPELPDPPQAHRYTGPDGRAHAMEFRLWRAPTGIVAEAQETSAPVGERYHVEVLGDHDADVDELLRTLRSRVHAQVDRLYLTPTHNWPEWILADDEVVGRLVYQEGEATYGVVVDGRTLSWEEFGGTLGPYEGLQFRLVMGDPVDDMRPDADVIPLPTTDTHRTEVLSRVDGFNDEDDEQFLAEWDAAEQHAVQVVRKALASSLGAPPPEPDLRHAAAAIRDAVRQNSLPHRHIAGAAGWTGSPPSNDKQCCVEAAGALIGMHEESGMGDDEVAMIMALEHADWLGAVIGLVRSGPGSAAKPRDLVRLINDCTEVDGLVDQDETTILEGAFDSVLDSWEAVGVVDDNRRLTVLGNWLLPRALAWAWNADFDDENPF
jgi:hypothetical protein